MLYCNVRNYKRFLFGVSPNVPASESGALHVILNFE